MSSAEGSEGVSRFSPQSQDWRTPTAQAAEGKVASPDPLYVAGSVGSADEAAATNEQLHTWGSPGAVLGQEQQSSQNWTQDDGADRRQMQLASQQPAPQRQIVADHAASTAQYQREAAAYAQFYAQPGRGGNAQRFNRNRVVQDHSASAAQYAREAAHYAQYQHVSAAPPVQPTQHQQQMQQVQQMQPRCSRRGGNSRQILADHAASTAQYEREAAAYSQYVTSPQYATHQQGAAAEAAKRAEWLEATVPQLGYGQQQRQRTPHSHQYPQTHTHHHQQQHHQHQRQHQRQHQQLHQQQHQQLHQHQQPQPWVSQQPTPQQQPPLPSEQPPLQSETAGQGPFAAPAVAPLAAAGPRLNAGAGATGAAASFAEQAAALSAQQAAPQQASTDPSCAPSMPFGRSASWPTADGYENSLWAPPDSSQQLPLSSLGPLMVAPLEEALLAGNMQHISLGELSLAAPALPEWSSHMG